MAMMLQVFCFFYFYSPPSSSLTLLCRPFANAIQGLLHNPKIYHSSWPLPKKRHVFFFCVLAVLAGSTQTSATTCPATTAEGLANRPFSFSSNWAMRRRERDKPAGSYIQVLHGPQTFQLAGGESITVPIRFQVKRGGAKPTAE